MRKIFALTILLFISFNLLNAQRWAAPGARWKINQENPFSPPNYAGELFNVDTVVNGIHCVITKGEYSAPISYLSNDTVYFLNNDNRFLPCLYFSARVGDTLTYQITNSCRPEDSLVNAVTDSVYYVRYANDSIKTFRLKVVSPDSIYSSGWYPDYKTFYFSERLGFTAMGARYDYFGVLPSFLCHDPSATDVSIRDVCNYGDSSISGFWLRPDTMCYTTGIAETLEDAHVLIYPNPASTYISIQTTTAFISLQIYDLLGKSILQIDNTQNIDISQLTSGLYVLSLKNSSGYMLTRRFLKE